MKSTGAVKDSRGWTLLAVLLLPVLTAAGAAEDWVRRGNDAYEHGDYAAALEAYARAVPETTDPGQVAFNQAAACYQLGQYTQAEEAYRRCLEDAAGGRRVRALYGLANALAQQGRQRTGRPAI